MNFLNKKIDEKEFYFYNDIYNFTEYFVIIGENQDLDEKELKELDEGLKIIYGSMRSFYEDNHEKFDKYELTKQFIKGLSGNTKKGLYKYYQDYLEEIKNGAIKRGTRADIIKIIDEFILENSEEILGLMLRKYGIKKR